MFQLVAELYMRPKEALYSTLLMATFPFISVFTILGYSEAFFLFSSLCTWYFYKKKRMIASSLLAGVASVTRIYGIIILLPILIDMVKTRAIKLWYLFAPAVMLASWAFYCLATTGDPFVSLTDEGAWSVWVTGAPGIKFGLIPSILLPGLRGVVVCCGGWNAFDPAVLVSTALFAYLIAKVWRVDRLLWGYAVSIFGLMVFVAPIISLLRFLSFIFPVWLTVRLKSPWIVALCIALFIPFTFLLWLYALLRNFIG
jgi:hypothetical protein